MRLLALIVVVLFILALVWLVMSALKGIDTRRRQVWVVDQQTLPDDGTMQVVVRRGARECRVVKELPPAMDPIDFRVELDAAMDLARIEARELNRRR